MTRTQRPSPIPKFLGVSASAGVLDMLGLSPSECTPQRIDAALQRQLDRVAQHPEGDTPEADEVRLALHTAAAQLSDPTIRQALLREYMDQDARGRLHEPPASTSTAPMDAMDPESQPIPETVPHVAETAALRRLREDHTSSDGNAPVRTFLVIGAVALGLIVGTFVVLAVFLSPTGTQGTAQTSGAGDATNQPPVSPSLSENAPNAGTVAKNAPEQQSQSAAPSIGPDGRTSFTDGTTMVRALREAIAAAREHPAGDHAKFMAAIRPVAEWWPRIESGQRRAADAAIIEYLYVVGSIGESAQTAVQAVSAYAVKPLNDDRRMTAEEVWPAAWAIGVLSRLSAERELPRAASAAIASALNDALGAGRTGVSLTFEDGAATALRRMPLRLVALPENEPVSQQRTSAQAFKNWADAVQIVAGDASGFERFCADALEQVLVAGPEPQEDAASYEAVEILVTRIRWRADGPARQRLLDWFLDARVSNGDMAVVTSVLAGKSNAEGVSATMVLGSSATLDDRAKLMSEYAQAWGITRAEAKEQALERWRTAATGVAGQATSIPMFADDVEGITRVLQAVKLNEAARRLWLQDAAGAVRSMDDITGIPSAIVPVLSPGGTLPSGLPSTPTPGSGGGKTGMGGSPSVTSGGDTPSGWSESFFRAERNIPLRLQRLQEAEQLSLPLSRLDAAVLVDTACYGSPIAVRMQAQKVVSKFAEDASIVLACLDRLPDAPKVRGTAEMFDRVARAGRLPKLGDPDWELAMRRALVDRALALLAAQSPQASVDQATLIIGDAYVRMAGLESTGLPDAPADRASRGARELFKLWRMEADRLPPAERPPLTLEQIDRRHASRRAVAVGPIQSFAAEQQSAAEMLSYVVSAERPVQTSKAREIMDQLMATRRGATHIFQQMLATEWAMTRLWRLRFGEGGV